MLSKDLVKISVVVVLLFWDVVGIFVVGVVLS